MNEFKSGWPERAGAGLAYAMFGLIAVIILAALLWLLFTIVRAF